MSKPDRFVWGHGDLTLSPAQPLASTAGTATHYAAEHAPEGGESVSGHAYKGGQFVPNPDHATATEKPVPPRPRKTPRPPSITTASPADRPLSLQARDAYSTAKLNYFRARSDHRFGGGAPEADRFQRAKAALPMARAAYLEATGGQLDRSPLDHADPRVRALRDDREGLLPHGQETDPDPFDGRGQPGTREAREDRVLMGIDSPLRIEHHHGLPAPGIARADAPIVRRVAKKYEAGLKPLNDIEKFLLTRYLDQKASDAPRHGLGRGYLVHDRLTGEHFDHADIQFRYSTRYHESFRSGRLDPLKAYGPGGREIPITQDILDHLRGGAAATRESNHRRSLLALSPDHPKRLAAGL